MIVLIEVGFGAKPYAESMELFTQFFHLIKSMDHLRVGQFSFLVRLQGVNELTPLADFCKRATVGFFVLELPGQVRSTWSDHPDVREWLRGKGVLVEPIQF